MVLQPVILSGGSGTRLWPLSREKHPKQLLALIGEETMLQATATRIRDFDGVLPVTQTMIVVCNEEYRFITAEQLRAIGFAKPTLLLEPAGRNTAPALTLAAIEAAKNDADAVLLIMPADHVIADVPGFHAAIQSGLPQAIAGAMVTFGIVPNRPETGYGYIQVGDALPDSVTRSLRAFVEKPALETAQQYLQEGNYLWNSGIFMLRASVWLKAIAHLNPAMYDACKRSMQEAKVDCDFVRVDKDLFLSCPSDSIDYAVMEKLPASPDLGIPGCVVPFDAGWSDVGAWDAVWQVSDKDAQGNSVHGEVMMEDSRNCLVISDSRLVTCLGLDDAIVIETPDAVLVTNKHNTQNIKRIVNRMKEGNYPQTDNHRKVYRPWGHYDSIDSGEHFQVKRIVVTPGGRLSMQMHHHRAEHWIVVSGTALVTRGDETMTLVANQSTYIPLGVKHRLENQGTVDLELIEVQSGAYLGEDDIVRFDDIYGRVAG
ncbi:mannose-1-phosphate guanylyltransferase/mannose-6-phosphate isomerase [Undibacterium sp. RuTC16W]|uniref:mannose-1-phosphate guanylyltransferase/mannose-6-phosphate isomerase n=1 Tax=Undibacterium sp. RuTC16W TaxID=3413048 RepID=UPI003BEF9D39